ncbi:PAS domain S-box protein [Paenibacillus selenitireducens]|uniref:PAS domain S-box protein n=1 Tax=Paenibacillus selenitireducens TaxID=1324314 RepID=A0A1T2XHT8_9BACL|nr:DUF438 domain-containing protein [Paenibacillus selenitireducens]OPA79451.1 PAS domain S-box protein [Paenibacillus selenitireducens]
MSEMINNREQQAKVQSERQHILKDIIKQLHQGAPEEAVRERFKQAVGNISVAEISQLEEALMKEEGIPVSEVQRLCSVHASIFEGSIDQIHRSDRPEDQPGHPIHTFKIENKEIDLLVNFKIQLHLEQFQKEDSKEHIFKLIEDLNLLLDVDKHYSRKENLLFPYLEKYGINGPSKVMWGVDDMIRSVIKEVRGQLFEYNGDKQAVVESMEIAIREVTQMIFKEENILFPMALETLTEDEWLKIAQESAEIGFCLTAPTTEWKPIRHPLEGVPFEEAVDQPASDGYIRLETGILSVKQLELMMNHLPVDITFIDQDDVVRYFSHGKERIFARTKAVIGRTVQNCHPPQSVHVVNQLLAEFKAGTKDVEDFWIPIQDKFVFIRYFAVRDEEGNYQGTLEFTQNIAPIRELEGQKRILSS